MLLMADMETVVDDETAIDAFDITTPVVTPESETPIVEQDIQ
jgi:hypothetical protein